MNFSLKSMFAIWSTPEKLLGGGLSTPVPPFCLFCTIISNKTCILDLYQNMPHVLAARSFLVAGFDTHVIPKSFSCDYVIQLLQPIQLVLTFLIAVSKLKAQSSNVSFDTFQ